LKSKISSIN